jgi:hypothetical protein
MQSAFGLMGALKDAAGVADPGYKCTDGRSGLPGLSEAGYKALTWMVTLQSFLKVN